MQLKKIGDYEAADRVLTEAVTSREHAVGETDSHVLLVRGHVAGCKFAKGQYAAAEAYNRETLARQMRLPGPLSKKAIIEREFTRQELATCLFMQLDSHEGAVTKLKAEEVIALLLESLQCYKDFGGEDKGHVIPILQLLASTHLRLNQYEKAETYVHEVVQQKWAIDTPYNNDAILCRFRLAGIKLHLHKLKEARALYTEILDLVNQAADNGAASEVTVYDCQEGIVCCITGDDQWRWAIREVQRKHGRSILPSSLGSGNDNTLRGRWKLIIEKVVRKIKIDRILRGVRNRERWRRAVKQVIKIHHLRFAPLCRSLWLDTIAKRNAHSVAKGRITFIFSAWRSKAIAKRACVASETLLVPETQPDSEILSSNQSDGIILPASTQVPITDTLRIEVPDSSTESAQSRLVSSTELNDGGTSPSEAHNLNDTALEKDTLGSPPKSLPPQSLPAKLNDGYTSPDTTPAPNIDILEQNVPGAWNETHNYVECPPKERGTDPPTSPSSETSDFLEVEQRNPQQAALFDVVDGTP